MLSQSISRLFRNLNPNSWPSKKSFRICYKYLQCKLIFEIEFEDTIGLIRSQGSFASTSPLTNEVIYDIEGLENEPKGPTMVTECPGPKSKEMLNDLNSLVVFFLSELTKFDYTMVKIFF